MTPSAGPATIPAMFGRKKRKQDTPEIQVTVNNAPSTGGYQPAELQVFDGKGHRAVMTFSANRKGQIVQRIRRTRDFKAHLPHVER